MDDYLKCECGEVFSRLDASERIDIEYNDAWGHKNGTFVFVTICPACSSDQVDDYAKCDTDKCMEEALMGVDECYRCFATNSPQEFADYAQRWPEDLPASHTQNKLS